MKKPSKATATAGEVFAPHIPKGTRITKRVALYLRVSSDVQTTENQEPELLRIVKARGWTVVRKYIETQSAAKKRPIYDRLMEDARTGVFDVLAIWSLDRFGRSMVGNLKAVLELDRFGVTTVSARESWLEVQSEARPLLIGIMSWVAEQERVRLSERTIAGMQRARAAGRVVGRPRAHVPLSIARKLLEDGHSRVFVARKLGTSPASLARALGRETSPKGVSAPKRAK